MHWELVRVDRPNPPLRGGTLDYVDEEKAPEVVPRHRNPELRALCESLFETAAAEGEPLRMIEIRCFLDGAKWVIDTSTETIAEFHETTAAREELDARVRDAMAPLWEEGTDRIIFTGRRHHPVTEPAEIIVLSSRKGRLTLPLTPEFEALEHDLYDFYEKRGHKLYSFSYQMDDPAVGLEPMDHYSLYYG